MILKLKEKETNILLNSLHVMGEQLNFEVNLINETRDLFESNQPLLTDLFLESKDKTLVILQEMNGFLHKHKGREIDTSDITEILDMLNISASELKVLFTDMNKTFMAYTSDRFSKVFDAVNESKVEGIEDLKIELLEKTQDAKKTSIVATEKINKFISNYELMNDAVKKKMSRKTP